MAMRGFATLSSIHCAMREDTGWKSKAKKYPPNAQSAISRTSGMSRF
jgi:hypothetical protein